jgi:hypothetical protein
MEGGKDGEAKTRNLQNIDPPVYSTYVSACGGKESTGRGVSPAPRRIVHFKEAVAFANTIRRTLLDYKKITFTIHSTKGGIFVKIYHAVFGIWYTVKKG